MFLPVNIGKFCIQYFNFYCKWYSWKQPSRIVSFKQLFILGMLGEVAASLPVKLLAACSSFSWKWTLSWMFLEYSLFYDLLCEWQFWGNCRLVATSRKKRKKRFLESTLQVQILDKYRVLRQFFIKHQLCFGLLQINNLLIQYYY